MIGGVVMAFFGGEKVWYFTVSMFGCFLRSRDVGGPVYEALLGEFVDVGYCRVGYCRVGGKGYRLSGGADVDTVLE